MNELARVDGRQQTGSTGEEGSLPVALYPAGELRTRADESIKPASDVEVHAQIQQLLETLPGMFSVLSADGQLEYVTHEFLEVVGLPLEELVGKKWISCLHPNDASGAVEEWARRRTASLPFQYCYRVRTRDGTYRWYQSLVKPLIDETGKVAKFYGHLTDVDAFSHPDESVRDSEQALRLLMDSVPALAWRSSAVDSSPESAIPHGLPSSAFNVKARILDLSLLAAVALEQLQLISASRFARDALARARANGMNKTSAAGCAATVLAHVHYELGDLDRAEQLIFGHLSFIRAGGTADVVIKAYTILSRIAQYRARPEQASDALSEGKAIGERRPCARVALTMMAERVRLWISRHEISRAQDEFVAMQRCESLLHSQNQSVGDEIGQICELTRWRLALAEGRGAEAIPLLQATCHAARAGQRRYAEFALTLELAGALDLNGQHESAERLIVRALQRSERYGLYQCWMDAGSACRTVLGRLAGQLNGGRSPKAKTSHSYLLSLFPAGNSVYGLRKCDQDGRPNGPSHLSSRECAVLALIARGQSNKSVAQTLRITPETVKSHLKRTFVKLQSKTRAEAVARATELGFLTGPVISMLSS